MTKSAPLSLVTIAVAVSAVCAGAWRAEAATYVQTNLVSNLPGFAQITDPNLVDPWGITERGNSPFWVADQGVSRATLYMVTNSTTVSPSGLIVAIPSNVPPPIGGPTGIVANSTPSFTVPGTSGVPSAFIFANRDGTISSWTGGLTPLNQAVLSQTVAGASYTGLAISQNLPQPVLYAANHAGTGNIDVFNSNFQPVSSTLFAGKFVDPNLPSGLTPFNVQDIGGKVYVTYAPANPATAGAGGVVDTFDESGNFLARVASAGSLASPWGVTFAPASFGQFGGDLLIGNFRTNSISAFAFNSTTELFAFVGTIPIDGPGGLLALEFGSGSTNGGSTNTLYFTDSGLLAASAATDGLFGAIEPTPLPAALPLFATGIGAMGLLGWRRKRKARAGA